MSDSFINKLTESTTVRGTDFAAFDIADPATGGFFTKKVSLDTITSKVKTEVNTTVQTQIDILQTNLNTISQAISNKLDKNGLTFAPTERMNGTLVVNATLSGLGETHFNSNVDVHNNLINNVKDPVNNFDAVNLKTVNEKIAQIVIPNTSIYTLKSGDTMTGALALVGDPTQNLHATPKQYIDRLNPFGKFVPLSGGTMTDALTLAADPTQSLHAVSKQYVDTKISEIQIPNTSGYILKTGDTMTGTLALVADPTQNLHAATKQYVDKFPFGKFVPLSGGTMTDVLTLAADPTQNLHATPKQYVDRLNPFGKFVPLSGGAMTGSLVLKGFSEKSTNITGTGSVQLNLDNGNTFPINLTGNITGFTLGGTVPSDSFSITMIITQTGAFTVTFTIAGTVVKWANNNTPVVTKTNGKVDIFAFTKIGTTWYGFNGGQNF